MLRSVKVPGINYWVRCGRMWRQVAILERPSGMPANALQSLTAQGSPFSGDRLIIHPDVYHAMPDRIERKRPHRPRDWRLSDLARKDM